MQAPAEGITHATYYFSGSFALWICRRSGGPAELVANSLFPCSLLRDIKGCCTLNPCPSPTSLALQPGSSAPPCSTPLLPGPVSQDSGLQGSAQRRRPGSRMPAAGVVPEDRSQVTVAGGTGWGGPGLLECGQRGRPPRTRG